jgi:hypothetical protein
MQELMVLGLYAGILTVVLGIIMWHMTQLQTKIDNGLATILSSSTGLTDDFKQDLYDLLHMALEDTVGNMKLPNAMDHIVGGLSQLVASRFGGMDPRNLINDAMSSPGYGEEEIQTEKTS